ncbi:unnamed protein product [Protopolystoma xenopodis]|uniref:Uncharacterized protein n=1 Tax=Protopolystoma xenopodis TaxID=117903 RepID=A0A3S5ATV6_9PLAT|nr:unnamed protein product [Protopolystoma xenopodis]
MVSSSIRSSNGCISNSLDAEVFGVVSDLMLGAKKGAVR